MAKQNWVTRSQTLLCDIQKVSDMTDVVCSLSNQAVVYDLFPYLWSMKGIFSLVKSFITWLGKPPFMISGLHLCLMVVLYVLLFGNAFVRIDDHEKCDV